MSENAYINEVAIKKGDIVKIKFKPLNDIIGLYDQNDYSVSGFLDDSDIDCNIAAVLQGGHFKVLHVHGSESSSRCFPSLREEQNLKSEQRPHEIVIENHLAGEEGNSFRFNQNIIESITVEHDAADYYFSSKFQLALMKIDGALYINNKLVTKDDAKMIDILEATISDLAIQKMLEVSEEE